MATPWRTLLGLVALGLALWAPASSGAGWNSAGGPLHFLPVEQAFPLVSEWQGSRLVLTWQIADGYALYKSRLRIEPADAVTWTINGREEIDPDAEPEFRSKYSGPVEIAVALRPGVHPGAVTVIYQGCSLHGLCYPPQRAVLPRP